MIWQGTGEGGLSASKAMYNSEECQKLQALRSQGGYGQRTAPTGEGITLWLEGVPSPSLRPLMEEHSEEVFRLWQESLGPAAAFARGRFRYAAAYPRAAFNVRGGSTEEEIEDRVARWKRLRAEYVERFGNGRAVPREHITALRAEKNDLEEQIEREGEKLEALCLETLSVLEVLWAEWERAGAEVSAAYADERLSDEDLVLMWMYHFLRPYGRFWRGGSVEKVLAAWEEVAPPLEEAGVSSILIEQQLEGIRWLLGARDALLGPMRTMNERRVVLERFLHAARMGQELPPWKELERELHGNARHLDRKPFIIERYRKHEDSGKFDTKEDVRGQVQKEYYDRFREEIDESTIRRYIGEK